MKTPEPNIFAYNDYRSYLRDWIHAKQTAGFSMRWFAKRAGFRAHNIMTLVSTAKRNLSMSSIAKFALGLGLNDEQGQYFEDLVLMNQSSDMKTRTKHYRKLVEHPDRHEAIPFEASQYKFFRHWLGPVVYEMTRLKGFKPDPRWIAGCFVPELSHSETDAVISDLVNSGFLALKANGSLVAQPLRLDTGDGVTDMFVYAYHEQALSKASDALHWVDADDRHFQVVTSAASSRVLPKLRKIAAKFEDEVWELLEKDTAVKDEVYQVSLQIFPTIGKPIGAAPRRKPLARKRGDKK